MRFIFLLIKRNVENFPLQKLSNLILRWIAHLNLEKFEIYFKNLFVAFEQKKYFDEYLNLEIFFKQKKNFGAQLSEKYLDDHLNLEQFFKQKIFFDDKKEI